MSMDGNGVRSSLQSPMKSAKVQSLSWSYKIPCRANSTKDDPSKEAMLNTFCTNNSISALFTLNGARLVGKMPT